MSGLNKRRMPITAQIETKSVHSVLELIEFVKQDYSEWKTEITPWFRGEPRARYTALQPSLFRKRKWRDPIYENRLLQGFRRKAPSLGLENTPTRDHTDEWLFLAQHVGLPTRLLDWSESLFVALHFALLETRPVLWMLHPIALNVLAAKDATKKVVIQEIATQYEEFPLSWYSPGWTPMRLADLLLLKKVAESDKDNPSSNPFDALEKGFVGLGLANRNVKAAWEKGAYATELPVAIHPANIHNRMSAQKSCFTIHGSDKRSLALQVDSTVLRKYEIEGKALADMRKDLRMLGVTHASVFPDLDGLARDLKSILP